MTDDVTIRWGPFERHLKLTAGQKSLLHENSSPRVVITGPPGSGKTAALMLKGLEWLKAGHDVIVFSLHALSIGSSRLVFSQLSEAFQRSQGALFPKDWTWGRVRYEHKLLGDARDLEPVLQTLLKYGNELHVLMDDFCPDDGFRTEMMLVFMRELRGRAPNLHLWATNFFTKIPETFNVHLLTEATRNPMPLIMEVSMAVEILKAGEVLPDTHGYTRVTPGVAGFGPEVIRTRHHGRGERKWPVNSEKCGRQVAKILRDIGVQDITGTAAGGRYTYRDVLILTRNPVEPDKPQPFVRGLQRSGFPVQVFGERNQGTLSTLFDDIILAKENKVTLMNCLAARGLDRAVVVCLTGACASERYELNAQDEQEVAESLQSSLTLSQTRGIVTETMTVTARPTKEALQEAKQELRHRMKAKMELIHRLEIWSRACSQLIVVHLPKGMEGGPSGSDDFGGGRKCVVL